MSKTGARAFAPSRTVPELVAVMISARLARILLDRIDSRRLACVNSRCMDAEEREICDFLKSWPDQFVSQREICRRAGGKWRFREDPNWAWPALSRMVEKGIVESDAAGHFRLMPETKDDKKKRWISPLLKKTLEEGGGSEVGGVTEIEDPGEPNS
jgi:hypothetical protein